MMARIAGVVTALTLALVVAGCATPAAPGGPTDDGTGGDGIPLPEPYPSADTVVIGQGLVLQQEGADSMLCLGPVATSYPPQCSGPPIDGWDWSSIELKESASGVTWGSYAVVGTWDGVRFAATEPPVPLALYDPMVAAPDPRLDPAQAGASSEAELLAIQDELLATPPFPSLSSSPQNGYLWVTVLYDDGSLQQYVDERYGEQVVVIVAALQPIG